MSVNIVLTGLMGVGKSTVGKALEKRLKDYKLIDIDEEIERVENMSIPEIFEKKSEEYFRNLEVEIIEKYSKENNLIISIGGGAFENETNRENLLKSGKVFYLYAPVDILFERVKVKSNRPLLYCDDPRGKLAELLAKREVNYKKAHYTIDTSNKTTDEIVEEIIQI